MPAWMKSAAADKVKLDELSWDAYGLFWALQSYCAFGAGVATVERRKVASAAGRRISQKRLDAALDELIAEGLLTVAGDVLEHSVWHQPPPEVWDDATQRERWARGKRLLRDNELTGRIKQRDRNCCRYCGIRVRWGAQKARDGGTYDHVDPDGDNSMGNVVVACRGCNGHKKDRTPEQAGMVLLPVPGSTGIEPGVEPGSNQRPISLVRARETGPGRIGVQPGSNPGHVQAQEVAR